MLRQLLRFATARRGRRGARVRRGGSESADDAKASSFPVAVGRRQANVEIRHRELQGYVPANKPAGPHGVAVVPERSVSCVVAEVHVEILRRVERRLYRIGAQWLDVNHGCARADHRCNRQLSLRKSTGERVGERAKTTNVNEG